MNFTDYKVQSFFYQSMGFTAIGSILGFIVILLFAYMHYIIIAHQLRFIEG